MQRINFGSNLENEESSEFTVIFTLPDEQQPIEVKCRSRYLRSTEEGVEIGAKFVDPYAQSYRPLRQYLHNH